jgi:hypothetical protein
MVIAVVGAMAAYGIAEARQRIRLTNSARLLASYLEKARVDSIRRHPADSTQMASLTFTSNTSYTVRYDMDGNGTLDTRVVNLDTPIFIANNPLPVPTRFNWRGRFQTDDLTITRNTITLQYGNSKDDQRTIDITSSGDVTVGANEYLDDVPNVNVNSNYNGGVDNDSTVNGNVHPSPSPTGNPSASPSPSPSPDSSPDPSPTRDPSPSPSPSTSPNPSPSPSPSPSINPSPSPSPSPSPAPCVVDIAPPALSVHKNGGSGNLVFTVTGGSGAVALTSGVPNLQVTETSPYHFTVTSLNNSRGDFTLYFSTPCGSRQVTVTVTN